MTQTTKAARSRIAPAEAERIADAYRAGKSIREIAAATSRSYGGIHHALNRAGVRFRPRGTRRTS